MLIMLLSLITTLPLLKAEDANALTTATSRKGDLDWQIKSRVYYQSIMYCLSQIPIKGTGNGGEGGFGKTAEEVNSGSWFNNYGLQFTPGVYMGDLNDKNFIDISSNSAWNVKTAKFDPSGMAHCNGSIVSRALSLWDISGAEILCNSGFIREDFAAEGQTPEQCINLSGKLVYKDSSNYNYNGSLGNNTVINSVRDAISSYIISKVYGGLVAEDHVPLPSEPLSNAQLYQFFLHSLAVNCITNIETTIPDEARANDSTQWGYNDISIVDKDFQIKTGSYVSKTLNFYKSDKLTLGSAIDGNTLEYEAGFHPYEQLTCEKVAKAMTNDLAQSYIDWHIYITNLGTTTETPGTKNDDPTTTPPTCGIPGLGWILCPIITTAASIADNAFTMLADNFLKTSPSIFGEATATYKVWSSIRTLANIIFVIVFLIIIFSQLTGIGIDNYGIKKMLPKIIIAVILVNLSYFICQIAVDLSNILGYSIQSFLATPSFTAGLATAKGWWSGGTDHWQNLAGGILGVTAIAGIAWASLATLIPALFAAIIALIMILLILIGRQAVIILLVVISPLAFVAYLLPNTEDLFKKWRKTLTSMLLLFPIIALVFGMSKLASAILSPVFTEGGNTIGSIVASLIVVLPFFVVPGLLKKSLDGIGALGGMINKLGDKGSKAFSGVGKKAYDNTALARGRSIRQQAKTNYRNQKFAKSLGKNGPRKFFANNQIPLSKASKYANQQLQRTAAAESDKADSIAVASEQALLEADILSGKRTASQAFNNAVKANDAIGAKAALNVKFQTAGGRTESHALLKTAEAATAAGTFRTDNLQSLRRHISVSQPDMDTKDATIADFGHNKIDPATGNPWSVRDLENGTTLAGTYKLSDAKMMGQAKSGLEEAYYSAHTLDAAAAGRILANPSAINLKTDEREFLQHVSAGTVPPRTPTSGFPP